MRNSEQNKRKSHLDGPQNVWEEFGLPRPEYEDEGGAPPVDRAALRALVEQRLPETERRELYRLTLRFRSWAEALAELDIESLTKDLCDPKGSHQGVAPGRLDGTRAFDMPEPG